MGLEPTTYGTTIRRSNQLSYIHHVALSEVSTKGFARSLPKSTAKLVLFFELCKFFGNFFSKKFQLSQIPQRGKDRKGMCIMLKFIFFTSNVCRESQGSSVEPRGASHALEEGGGSPVCLRLPGCPIPDASCHSTDARREA